MNVFCTYIFGPFVYWVRCLEDVSCQLGKQRSCWIRREVSFKGESVVRPLFCKKGVLRNFAKFTCVRSPACNFIKIETLAQVFSSRFCKISQNTFSYRTPPVASSAEVYSQPCRKFKMDGAFCENTERLEIINYFHKSFIRDT